MTFEEKVHQAVEHAVLSELAKTHYLKLPYGAIEISHADIKSIYEKIDMAKVKEMVLHQVEEMLATKIVHALATEFHNDVKTILSNNQMRTELRDLVKGHIQKFAGE